MGDMATPPSLRERIAAALDASIDRCARCKVCDAQIDAVMAVLAEQGVWDTSVPSFGTVLDVAGNRLRVWVSGVTGPDGAWMPVPQDAPAWLTEKGRDFRVSGDLRSLETATYTLQRADELQGEEE